MGKKRTERRLSMSLGLSALVQVCAQKPKSQPLKQSAHMSTADDTALGVGHAKTARNPLRDSLRNSLLPIAQLASPHCPLRSSSPASRGESKQLLPASPARTARNSLRNSLRKSLLPIAQLAAPHNQLRSSSPAIRGEPKQRLPASPAGTARNSLRNSLRKSLLPIAQLAAPHNQLRSS